MTLKTMTGGQKLAMFHAIEVLNYNFGRGTVRSVEFVTDFNGYIHCTLQYGTAKRVFYIFETVTGFSVKCCGHQKKFTTRFDYKRPATKA